MSGNKRTETTEIVDDRSDTTASVSGAHAEARMLKRPEAARALNLSVTQLRRLEKSVLPPTVTARGVNMHSEQQILEYRIQRSATFSQPAGPDAGDLAATAFEMFDAGAGPIELVRAQRIDPRTAEQLHKSWVSLAGGMVLDARAVAELDRLAEWSVDLRVKTSVDVLAVLNALADDKRGQSCEICPRQQARFCVSCFMTRPPKARRHAEDLLAAQHSRMAERARAGVEERCRERAHDERRATDSNPDADDEQPETGSPGLKLGPH